MIAILPPLVPLSFNVAGMHFVMQKFCFPKSLIPYPNPIPYYCPVFRIGYNLQLFSVSPIIFLKVCGLIADYLVEAFCSSVYLKEQAKGINEDFNCFLSRVPNLFTINAPVRETTA